MRRATTLCLGVLCAWLGREPSARADPIDVTVTGGPLSPTAEDATVASTVVEGEPLARPGAALTDALSAVPSVRVSRSGSGADLATIGLRGASNAETPVYLAGVKLNDELSGTADLSTVPLFFLHRLTVFRGDAPFELGGGLGGAVLLEPSLPRETRVGSGLAAGSFGERSAWLLSSVGTRAAAAAFAIRYDTSKNDFLYTDDRGTRFDPSDDRVVRRTNADATVVDAWAVARARLGDRGSVVAVTNVMSREQGVTGLGILPATSARAKTRRALFAAEARARCEANPRDDACEIVVSAFGKSGAYLYLDPLRELPIGAARETVSGESAGVRIALREQPVRWARVRAGAGELVDLLGVDPAGAAALRARRSVSRAFASAELVPLDALTFALAGSLASSRTAGPDAGTNALLPEARVGATVAPLPELRFFANVARYVRQPLLGELYGSSASVLGNTSLSSEKGLSFEVGARGETRLGASARVAGEALFFYRSARQLIAFRRTSIGVLRPYNVDAAHVLGGEATLALELFRMLRFDDALTLTDARDDSAGRTLANDALPFQAAIVDAAGVHLVLRDLWPRVGIDGLGLGTTFVYRSARAADPAGLIELPAQRAWDADASLGFAHDALTARVRISNLLDDRSTDAVGYPLPGRAGHVSLEAWWP